MKQEKWFKLKGRKRKKTKSVNMIKKKSPLKKGEFMVNSIVRKEIRESRVKYQVNWKGYPDPKDNTWEPVTNLLKCVTQVKHFDAQPDSGKHLKPYKIRVKEMKASKQTTESSEELIQVLGYHLKSKTAFVQWANSMVTTLQLKGLEIDLQNKIINLVNPDTEENDVQVAPQHEEPSNNKPEGASPDEIESPELERLIESAEVVCPDKHDPEYFPCSFEGILLAKNWLIYLEEGDSWILLNPNIISRRTDTNLIPVNHQLAEHTLCDNCGRTFAEPDLEFFQHLLQKGHNGCYLVALTKIVKSNSQKVAK